MTEEVLFIDVQRFREISREVGALPSALAMDIIIGLWSPSKQAVPSDPKKLVEMLSEVFPRRAYTAELIAQELPAAMPFFVKTTTGDLAPSPELLSANDPYLEGELS